MRTLGDGLLQKRDYNLADLLAMRVDHASVNAFHHPRDPARHQRRDFTRALCVDGCAFASDADRKRRRLDERKTRRWIIYGHKDFHLLPGRSRPESIEGEPGQKVHIVRTELL